MNALNELANLHQELVLLRDNAKIILGESQELARELSKLRLDNEKLQLAYDRLQKGKCLHANDEKLLFSHGAELKFQLRLGGGRKVSIRAHGRKISEAVESEESEKSALAQAITSARKQLRDR